MAELQEILARRKKAAEPGAEPARVARTPAAAARTEQRGAATQQSNADAARSGEGSACDNFRVDITASAFGVCKCGHPKADHKAPSLGRPRPISTGGQQQARSISTKLAFDHGAASIPSAVSAPAPPSPRKAKSAASESTESRACDEFRVDVTAAKFGTCKCGFHKSQHSRAALAPSSRRPQSRRSISTPLGQEATEAPADANHAQVPKLAATPPSTSRQTTSPSSSASQKESLTPPLRKEESPPPSNGNGHGERYRALYDLKSSREGDLSLAKGDILVVDSKDGDWWTGHIGDRNGLFPANYVEKAPEAQEETERVEEAAPKPESTARTFVKALYTFETSRAGDLHMEKGEVIEVLNKEDAWWEGQIDERKGQFPANYVEEISQQEYDALRSSVPKAKLQEPHEEAKVAAKAKKVPLAATKESTSSRSSVSALQSKLFGSGGPPMPKPAASTPTETSPPTPPSSTSATPPPPLAAVKLRAIFPFKGSAEEDELSFKTGDIITLDEKRSDGWWTGVKADGSKGMFPGNYVEEIEEEPKAKKPPPPPPSPPSGSDDLHAASPIAARISKLAGTASTRSPSALSPGASPPGPPSPAPRARKESSAAAGSPPPPPPAAAGPKPQARKPAVPSPPPPPPPPPPAAPAIDVSSLYRAIDNFPGPEDGDLTFELGDYIIVTEMIDENWRSGKVITGVYKNANTKGMFPVNFVEKVHADEVPAELLNGRAAAPPPSSSPPPPPPPSPPAASPASGGAPPPPPPPPPSQQQEAGSAPQGLTPGISSGELRRKPSLQSSAPPAPWYSAGETYSLKTSTQSGGFLSSGGGTIRVDVYNILKKDRTKVRLEIRQSLDTDLCNYSAEVQPFVAPSPEVMSLAAKKYGPIIVHFAEDNLGRRVGNGECWTLAKEALSCAKTAPVIGFNFGAKVGLDQVMPGDVLQFTSAKFRTDNGWKSAGSPNHTAIVHSRLGPQLFKVLEQNPNPVAYGEYDFARMTEGSFDAYRPIPPDDVKMQDLQALPSPPSAPSAESLPPPPPPPPPPARGPKQCKALWDFDADQEGDLGFRAGDVITLTSDDNTSDWIEGSLNGATGTFPRTYVEMLQ